MTMVLEVFIIMEFQNHVVIVKYDNVVLEVINLCMQFASLFIGVFMIKPVGSFFVMVGVSLS